MYFNEITTITDDYRMIGYGTNRFPVLSVFSASRYALALRNCAGLRGLWASKDSEDSAKYRPLNLES